jgi:hypothetical protein
MMSCSSRAIRALGGDGGGLGLLVALGFRADRLLGQVGDPLQAGPQHPPRSPGHAQHDHAKDHVGGPLGSERSSATRLMPVTTATMARPASAWGRGQWAHLRRGPSCGHSSNVGLAAANGGCLVSRCQMASGELAGDLDPSDLRAASERANPA